LAADSNGGRLIRKRRHRLDQSMFCSVLLAAARPLLHRKERERAGQGGGGARSDANPSSGLFGEARDLERISPDSISVADRCVSCCQNPETTALDRWCELAQHVTCCRNFTRAMLPALVLSAAGRSVVQFAADESAPSNNTSRVLSLIAVFDSWANMTPAVTFDSEVSQ
jgi:hypothetical protein